MSPNMAPDISIQQLFPDLTPDQQKQVAEFIDEYFAVLLRVAKRLDHQCERAFDGPMAVS